MISNCGHDENNNYTGGAAGDQAGNEYAVIPWYNRPWSCVLRYPDPAVGAKIAEIAKAAALNNKIGYDQGERLTYYYQLKLAGWNPAAIKTACEADCSSSTATNIIAAGYLLGIGKLQAISPSLTTRSLRAALKAVGFEVFTDSKYLTSDAFLLPGDILLYEGHHVAVNLDTGAKAVVTPPKKSGWLQEDGGWRFYNGDTGKCILNDWYHDSEKDLWYWFDGAGMMVTDTWYQYKGDWYYLGSDGAMCRSQLIASSGKIYAVDKDGKMITEPVTLIPGQDGALQM
jgi:hypothetical protein